MNFQMFKLDLEKAEELEIKLPTYIGSEKKQENLKKEINFCFTDCAKAFDCVDHNKLENSSRDENTRSLYLSPEKPVCRSRSNSWNRKWNDILVQSLDSSLSRLHFVTLLNFCAEHIMRNAGLDDAQAGIKIARRNINDLRYADDTTLMAESEEQ